MIFAQIIGFVGSLLYLISFLFKKKIHTLIFIFFAMIFFLWADFLLKGTAGVITYSIGLINLSLSILFFYKNSQLPILLFSTLLLFISYFLFKNYFGWIPKFNDIFIYLGYLIFLFAVYFKEKLFRIIVILANICYLFYNIEIYCLAGIISNIISILFIIYTMQTKFRLKTKFSIKNIWFSKINTGNQILNVDKDVK